MKRLYVVFYFFYKVCLVPLSICFPCQGVYLFLAGLILHQENSSIRPSTLVGNVCWSPGDSRRKLLSYLGKFKQAFLSLEKKNPTCLFFIVYVQVFRIVPIRS